MRKLGIILVLIGYFSIANCQTFKGTVYDRSTDSTLSSVIVYISGTSIGTYSDIHGNFELDISRYKSLPSLLGYYSVTLSEHSSSKMYNIYLSPKIIDLNEVVITGKKGKAEMYLRIFKREFLGETENATECEILNEKDLRFFYDSDSSTLREVSLKPILIRNKALGYTINYYLDKFKFSRKRSVNDQLTETCTILGNYLFKDDLSNSDESENKKIEERRKISYLGSRMHFFRSLYIRNLIQRGEYDILLSDNSSIYKGFSINSKTPIILTNL